MKREKITKEKEDQIRKLFSEGKLQKDIAEEVGISKSSVCNICKWIN